MFAVLTILVNNGTVLVTWSCGGRTMLTWNLACNGYCFSDVTILNTLAWTKNLDEIWRKTKEQDEGLTWQYFGSQTGVMRIYPGQSCNVTFSQLFMIQCVVVFLISAGCPDKKHSGKKHRCENRKETLKHVLYPILNTWETFKNTFPLLDIVKID